MHKKQSSVDLLKRRGFIKNKANHQVSASIDSLKDIVTEDLPISPIFLPPRQILAGATAEPEKKLFEFPPKRVPHDPAPVSPKNPQPIEKTNAYFKRVSVMCEAPQKITVRENLLQVARKLLFAFSETYQSFRKFNQINSIESLQELIGNVLALARKRIHKLVEAIEQCEASSTSAARALLVSHLVGSVHVFKVLALQMMENLGLLTKKTDVCFMRMLILLLFGCFNELYNAWCVMKPKDAPSDVSTIKVVLEERSILDEAQSAVEATYKTAGTFVSLVKAALDLERQVHSQSRVVRRLCQEIVTQNSKEGFLLKLDALVKENMKLLTILKELMPSMRDSTALRAHAAQMTKHTKKMILVVEKHQK